MIRIIKPELEMGEEELQAVKEVFKSGFLAGGRKARELESELAKYVGSKYCVTTNSCTSALEIAFELSKLNGGEVIVPDFSYSSTASSVLYAGGKVRLIDITLDQFNLDVSKIEENINENTVAICPVSEFGLPSDMKEIMEIAEKHNLKVIEDAAPALGSEYNGKKTGSISDITCFSFHPRKLITTGEGGFLTTNDEEVYKMSKSIRTFGMGDSTSRESIVFSRLGHNLKLSDIAAAIGLAQLKKLDRIVKQRNEKAKIYNELIEKVNGITAPVVPEHKTSTYQSYSVLLEKSNNKEVIQKMREKEIEVQVGTYALHLHPAFSSLPHNDLSNSKRAFTSSLTLPLYGSLTYEEQETVINELSKLI